MTSDHTRPVRRGGRGRVPDQGPVADAFRGGSSPRRPRLGLLSDSGVERCRSRAIELLETTGVVVTHGTAFERLRKAGASPGRESNRLRLPRPMIEEALAATPKSARLCGKLPERDLPLPRPDRGFVMRTGTGAHGFVDPQDGRYRNLTVEDATTIARLANGLDQVGFVAHPFVHGVPELTADIHSLAAILAHTDRHAWIQPYNKENVPFLMRLAAAAAGGEAELRRRPIASCIVCSFTPLEFKVMDLEAMVEAGRHGLPIHACSLPSGGGTAPVTVPGIVLMATAEILAMVTMAHVLAPGTPVIATPLMFTLDMRTGRSLQSCVESLQAAGMAVQVMKQGLGLLAHTYGLGSDTPDVDVQSMAERALLAETVALASADILGGVGQLECATVFSPVQAVLDNEIGAITRRLLAVPEADDEGFDWQEITTIRPGGHFLDSRHTLRYCRHQLVPQVFLRENRDDYERSGRRTAFDHAREICLELIARPLPAGLPDENRRRDMAGIVAAADREILALAAANPGASLDI